MYSKCLDLSDYYHFTEHNDIEVFAKGGNYRYEHLHRKWEYGLAIAFIKRNDVKTVLNIGGGNSPLSLYLARSGYKVTEVDPNTPANKFPGVTYIDSPFPIQLPLKYDAVLCTSVLEHIHDDTPFFRSLVENASSLVYVTVDFHPSGKQLGGQHLRTYNEDSMMELVGIANEYEFVCENLDYTYKGDNVYNYTFASLSAKRNL